MRYRFFIFTMMYFAIHLVFVYSVRADDVVVPVENGVVRQEMTKELATKDAEQQSQVVKDDVAVDENDDYDVVYDNSSSNIRRRWNIDGYAFLGYGMFFAQPLDMNGIAYGSLLRKFQHGFIVGGGIMLNNIYGIGLSFINMRGVDKIRKDDPRFRSIQNAYYMINLDISLIVPIRLFKDRLQFYVIGGVTGLFTDVNNRLKDGVNIDNPVIKFSFGANVGGGMEVFISRNLSARLEGRYMFVPTSSPVEDFFMMQIMLMLRI